MGTSRPRKIKAYTREDAIMRYLKSQNINLDHMGAKEADRFYTSVSCVSQAASALGKLGRSKNTEAQKNASRDNGKLGGYPKGRPRGNVLTPLQQQIYDLRHTDGLKIKEIAQQLGRQRENVRQILARAETKIRKQNEEV